MFKSLVKVGLVLGLMIGSLSAVGVKWPQAECDNFEKNNPDAYQYYVSEGLCTTKAQRDAKARKLKQAEAQRVARKKAEEERIARKKADAKRIAKEKVEAENLALAKSEGFNTYAEYQTAMEAKVKAEEEKFKRLHPEIWKKYKNIKGKKYCTSTNDTLCNMFEAAYKYYYDGDYYLTFQQFHALKNVYMKNPHPKSKNYEVKKRLHYQYKNLLYANPELRNILKISTDRLPQVTYQKYGKMYNFSNNDIYMINFFREF